MKLNSMKGFATVTLILNSFVFSAVDVAAQRRSAPKPTTASNSRSAGAAKSVQKPVCSGGWTGVVTLTKTLQDSHQSDVPGIRKEMDRIIQNTSRDYRYVGKAIVDNSDPQAPAVNSKINFSDKDKSYGLEKVFDACNSREKGHWFTIESSDDRITTAEASGPARSFNLSVNELNGTYSLSLQLPHAKGKYNRQETLRRAGHCQAKNNEPWDRTTNEEPRIEGESLSVHNEKLDPNDPDEISGSKVWGDDGSGTVRSFVYKATWRFTRCPQKLLITDLKFEHPEFPNYDQWKEVVEQTGTIDGNLIKVKATVLNLSGEPKFAEVYFKETYAGDKWNGSKPDRPLNDNTVSLRLDAGEEREVEILWNSSGYAWFDDGRPRNVQRIKAEAWENYKKQDELIRNLKVAPKPVIFIPGIWTGSRSFEIYQNLLTISHSYDWKAAVFSRKPRPPGFPASVYDNADDLAEFVRSTQKKLNAWHVDMAAHSTGGLVGRLFIHKSEAVPDDRPLVKHFMMLGTPNKGVPCADSMNLNDAFDAHRRTAQELMPDEMARFNQFVTEQRGTKFSALVGNGSNTLCASIEKSDGFTSVESASFGVEDIVFTSDAHPDLVDQKHFGEFIKPRLVTGPRGGYPLLQR